MSVLALFVNQPIDPPPPVSPNGTQAWNRNAPDVGYKMPPPATVQHYAAIIAADVERAGVERNAVRGLRAVAVRAVESLVGPLEAVHAGGGNVELMLARAYEPLGRMLEQRQSVRAEALDRAKRDELFGLLVRALNMAGPREHLPASPSLADGEANPLWEVLASDRSPVVLDLAPTMAAMREAAEAAAYVPPPPVRADGEDGPYRVGPVVVGGLAIFDHYMSAIVGKKRGKFRVVWEGMPGGEPLDFCLVVVVCCWERTSVVSCLASVLHTRPSAVSPVLMKLPSRACMTWPGQGHEATSWESVDDLQLAFGDEFLAAVEAFEMGGEKLQYVSFSFESCIPCAH